MRVLPLVIALAASLGCGDSGETRTEPVPTAPTEPKAQAESPAELFPHRVFATPEEALRAALASNPRVIGIGEYHQTTARVGIRSALSRFTEDLLPALEEQATDLVVETWAEYGKCGADEAAVSKRVKSDTERPASTENEIVALLSRAKELGIRPHVLPFDCNDYRMLRGENDQVDYERLLLLITERLRAQALAGLEKPKAVIAVYGGSTHNDLYPYDSVADFSYVKEVQEKAGGRYVEIDLYVPELVAGDPLLSKEPWYPLLARAAGPDKVLLVERGQNSYIMILRTSPVSDDNKKDGQ